MFTIDVSEGGKVRYAGINTRFRIMAVFKSAGPVEQELTVLHFSDEHTAETVANGPSFVYFPVAPLEYEKRFTRDGKEIAKLTAKANEPLILAYLKRRGDGRYEPVSGQEDAEFSFYEVHTPLFPHP